MKYAKFPLLLLCAAALAGCVREKLVDCTTTILFSYKGDGQTDIFADRIEHLDLFVFDEEHKVVMQYEPTAAELAAQKAVLTLPTARKYNIVAVGNMEHTELYSLHEGTIDSTKIMHPSHTAIGGDANIDTHPHLYMGREEVAIPPDAGTTHVIELGSSHVDVIVEVAGLPAPSSDPTRQNATGLSLEHINLPGWTDFNMNCVCPRGDLVSHIVNGEWDAEREVHVFTYQVMRDLKGGKNTRGSFLHLWDGDVDIFEDDPIDVEGFIQEQLMPNDDVPGPYDANGNLLHEAVVPIRIDVRDRRDVEVTIPDWAVEIIKPQF